ncbi:MAG: hypothetical protein ACREGI_04825 [Candidatus Levyibacteriota bacterium]
MNLYLWVFGTLCVVVLAALIFSVFGILKIYNTKLTAGKQNTIAQTVPTLTPSPTVVPVLIKQQQDVTDALKMVDSLNTTTIENDLSQNSNDASSFSQ